MFVYSFMHMFVYLFVYTNIHAYTHRYIYIYIYTYVKTHEDMHTLVCLSLCTHIRLFHTCEQTPRHGLGGAGRPPMARSGPGSWSTIGSERNGVAASVSAFAAE